MGVEEDIKEIKEKIKHPVLHIGRIPKKTYMEFVKLAEEEFCSDYGMAMKFLYDFYVGLIPTGIEHLEIELERQNSEIEKIKEVVFKKEEKKPSTRLDGTKR